MYDVSGESMSDVNITDISENQQVACKANQTRVALIRVTSIGAIVTGLVMISLQIAVLTMNAPLDSYDYVSHGIWAGLLSEISSVICLFALAKKTASLMISGMIMSFYSSAACLVSIVLSGLSIFNGSCLLSEQQCDVWNDTEWVLNCFSFCTFSFCAVLTVAMASSLNPEGVKFETLCKLTRISSWSIIVWGTVSIGLQIAALCTNDVTLSNGLAGQGIWAGAFYLATGTLGLLPKSLNGLNAVTLIVLSTLSGLFSIYITVQTGVAVSSGVCSPHYPCDSWKAIEWSLMAFSVVAFTEAAFLLFLSSIAASIERLLKNSRITENSRAPAPSVVLPRIRSVFV